MATLDASGLPVPDPEGEEGLDGEALQARDFVLTGLSPGELDYRIGSLEFDQFGGSNCSVIAIAVLDNKLLVAVPQEVWHRTVSQRLLGPRGLSKPALCSVAARPVGSLEGEDEPFSCKLWVGFLLGTLEDSITFPDELEVTYGFGPADGPPLVPVKGALLEVANDRYVFQTAESGSAVDLESSGLDGRLKFLEDSIIQIQKSIAGLSSVPPGAEGSKPTAGGLSAGSGSSAPRPTSKAKAVNAAAKPGLARGALAGMDPTVVQAAMAAGVPEKHLVEMAQVLKQRPSTLDDAPRARKKSVWSPLDESEEEEEAEAADGAGAEAGSSSEVGKALTKLTQICSTLVDQKQKKGDLEHLLDGSGLASSSESQNVPSSRRNAAALRALQRALKENPRLVYQSIEANLLSDFHAQPTAPGEPFGTATVRGWLTSRSRLQNFTSHVRWSWQVAGVWDSLIRGSHEEARARCAVLIAAADQAAIDSGNWIMANVRGSPTLPSILESHGSNSARASTLELVGPKMGRGLPGAHQRTGQLPGIEEEAGKRRGKGRSRYHRTRRCWRCKARAQEDPEEESCSRRQPGCRGSMIDEKFVKREVEAGSSCLDGFTTSQPNSEEPKIERVTVPGASAKTYSGKGVLSSMLRFLMGSRCRLGGFARSFVRLHFADTYSAETVSRGTGFPMGLPYPEVCRKNSVESPEGGAEKRSLNAIVIVLNYLHFNKPRDAKGLLTRKGLNRRQWEAIDRFKLFLKSWIEVSPTGPEEMGRSAGKFESLELILSELEKKAHALSESGQGYFRFEEEVMKPGYDGADSGCVVGCPSTDMSTFKQVDPERISFIGRPRFKAEKFLDPVGKEIFLHPLQCRADPDKFTGNIPRVKVHCSLSQKVRLFELPDASDRLHLWLPREVDLRFGAGMFCVVKSLTKDRLILDSRPGNLLEQPLGRWIRSLASGDSLLRLVLRPGSKVVSSGDWYHLFQVTSERSRRNCLVGCLDSRRLQHLKCMRPELRNAGRLVGSLGTLAMGDSQAVELAQTCHISLALSYQICREDEMITYKKPLPRSQTMVGILIDDFISLSVLPEDHDCAEHPSTGAQKADAMQDSYKAESLIPHEEKAFRDLEVASFWGIDLEGRRGVLRGAIRRAIPLCSIVMQIAALGHSTVDLLQIVAGALISLLLYRRRMLCLMDSIFGSCRGRGGREVIKLSGKCISELFSIAILLPLAASNLKSQISGKVVASDASNWGQAAVVADVPGKVAEELYRHCLRKSVWTRLLGPAAEWQRRHDLLEPEDELPGDEKFDMHPLWAICAQGLHYRLMFAKRDTSAKHINISELRGFLRAESRISKQLPSHRTLYGLDSQVCLGAIIKGRSSSRSLNRELCQALASLLFFDSYSEAMYFDTKKNRSDAPTRGREIPPPDVELPSWWHKLARGNYEDFDRWMEEQGLGDTVVGDLPNFEELKKSPHAEVGGSVGKADMPVLSSPTSFGKKVHPTDGREHEESSCKKSVGRKGLPEPRISLTGGGVSRESARGKADPWGKASSSSFSKEVSAKKEAMEAELPEPRISLTGGGVSREGSAWGKVCSKERKIPVLSEEVGGSRGANL